MGKRGQKKDSGSGSVDAGAGGAGGGNGKMKAGGSTREETLVRVGMILEDFRASDRKVYTFERGLSKEDRAAIHQMCRKMGMVSKSYGTAAQRRLFVYKTNKKHRAGGKDEDSVTFLPFSEDSRNVLCDLFTRYPPGSEEGGDMSRNGNPRKVRRKLDSSFRKPSMNSSDIARKADFYTNKMKNSDPLKKICEDRGRLPIASFKNIITSTLEQHQVLLISGETGCGKTTQVPQFILDHAWSKGVACKIICTQPRRISAISVAERISFERGETVGETVGYKIRLESKGGKNSSIMFCTNGILLRLLISRGATMVGDAQKCSERDAIMNISHIIVDEIHERDRFSDFMLAILRDFLPAYPHLRVVLMSATIDAERFSKYFSSCPIINVPGFTHPVKTFYLEDVLSILRSARKNHLNAVGLDDVALDEAINLMLLNNDEDQKETDVDADINLVPQASEDRAKHPKLADDVDLLDKYMSTANPELIDAVLVEQLLQKICTDSDDGAMLIFLPGWDDINQVRERLEGSQFFRDTSKFLILALHSMIPSSEQKKVFRRPPTGVRKIVLSTNIAETAITIDDVVFVIDTGRMKEKSYDPYNNVSTLHSSWVSKASARQREGRAGRCRPGICYHLYSKLRAVSLPDYQVPEIKRIPIEELCLQVKVLNPKCRIIDFLQKTVDPPVPEAVQNAILTLQDLGILTKNEELTELGEKLGSLSVHPSVSKMLLFSILMNCLDPALTLACAVDYRDPFFLPMNPDARKKATAAKAELASLYGGQSDQLAIVAAFEGWRRARERGQAAQFCSRYFVSSATMSMLFAMRKQLQSELAKSGLLPANFSSCSFNLQDPGILRAVLMAGAYPMVGRLLPRRINDKRTIVQTARGAKVRLHPHSSNFRLSCGDGEGCNSSPLIVYDEITRGDGGMYIRNCTAVTPLPLLLLAAELVVAPICGSSDEECSGSEGDEEEMVPNRQRGKLMASPENDVLAVVDKWMKFKCTALDIAQLYCLRERLSAAILFKVRNSHSALPPSLEASVQAIACLLSYESVTPAPMLPLTNINQGHSAPGPSSFLTDLFSNAPMAPASGHGGSHASFRQRSAVATGSSSGKPVCNSSSPRKKSSKRQREKHQRRRGCGRPPREE